MLYRSDVDRGIAMLRNHLQQDGFTVIPKCLDESTVAALSQQFAGSFYSQRNLLPIAIVREVATGKAVREVIEAALGSECFAVRGIFFNKTEEANWKVVWHQDLTIAIRERRDAAGFGPWTKKAGVWHVQPPANIMSGMLAIRLHLDESAIDNGPLRVIPGSHREGRLSMEQIASYEKNECVTCTVPQGGALMMNPLLLHSSSACETQKPRRVIHLEFANSNLPFGLDWIDKVQPQEWAE
jgi:ectoine hydroxylase-related dioxygenase (phytanoyl-CoA dioxygenase family)